MSLDGLDALTEICQQSGTNRAQGLINVLIGHLSNLRWGIVSIDVSQKNLGYLVIDAKPLIGIRGRVDWGLGGSCGRGRWGGGVWKELGRRRERGGGGFHSLVRWEGRRRTKDKIIESQIQVAELRRV